MMIDFLAGSKVKELELYVHIPFCVKKCAYCDFLSAPAGEEERQRYVDTLLKEIQGYGKQYQAYCVITIFVGGGTPSVLNGEQMKAIFNVLRESFVIDTDAEITIEVNPGTVTEEKAEAFARWVSEQGAFGSNMRGSEAYRRRLAVTLVRRCLLALGEE